MFSPFLDKNWVVRLYHCHTTVSHRTCYMRPVPEYLHVFHGYLHVLLYISTQSVMCTRTRDTVWIRTPLSRLQLDRQKVFERDSFPTRYKGIQHGSRQLRSPRFQGGGICLRDGCSILCEDNDNHMRCPWKAESRFLNLENLGKRRMLVGKYPLCSCCSPTAIATTQLAFCNDSCHKHANNRAFSSCRCLSS